MSETTDQLRNLSYLSELWNEKTALLTFLAEAIIWRTHKTFVVDILINHRVFHKEICLKCDF